MEGLCSESGQRSMQRLTTVRRMVRRPHGIAPVQNPVQSDPSHPPSPEAAISQSLGDALRHLGWEQLCEHFQTQLCSIAGRDRLEQDRETLRGARPGNRSFLLHPSSDLAQAQAKLAELDGLELLDRVEGVIRESSTVNSSESVDSTSPRLRDCLSQVADLRDTIDAARRGETLDTVELLGACDLLGSRVVFDRLVRVARAELRCSDDVISRRGLDALVRAVGSTCGDILAQLHATLSRSIDRDGGIQGPCIADGASPALKSARESVRATRQALLTQAERVIRSATVAKALQDRYWTERDGRVVLPVRRDALGLLRRDGRAAIIHGSSSTGQTVFVEPQSLVDGNNAVREAQLNAELEELRVRTRLSRSLGEHGAAVLACQEAMLVLDVVVARLSLSRRLNGYVPQLSLCGSTEGGSEHPEASPRIELRAARHPLMVLDGVEVVPNDIVLPAGEALIISGPNAGGKTVALKTLGLCVLMARSGLRLPTSRPGRLPLFTEVVTDVGDDQSIAANLSTFSAHLGHVMEALRQAERVGSQTLVLLDEVAVGTDPEQGAALAEAVLVSLVEAGATVVATTHYDRLKLLATREEGPGSGLFHNAAVGFDIDNLRPTFRVTLGIPGSSSALAVAKRLGLPEHVLDEAKRLLGDVGLRVDVLLQAIDAERHALARARTDLEDEQHRLRVRDQKIQQREQRALDGARSRKRKAYEAASDELRNLENELKTKRKHLRRTAGSADALPTRDAATGSSSRRIEALREIESPAVQGRAPAKVVVGMKVRVSATGTLGEVLSMRGKKATIQLENSRMTVAISGLLEVSDGGTSGSAKRTTKTKRSRGKALLDYGRPEKPASRASQYFGPDARPIKEGFDNACDLRGVRAEDAIDALEDFLAQALGADQEVVLVRHGHGSGALRSVVREHLARIAHVRRHRGGLMPEGGEAVTIVQLG